LTATHPPHNGIGGRPRRPPGRHPLPRGHPLAIVAGLAALPVDWASAREQRRGDRLGPSPRLRPGQHPSGQSHRGQDPSRPARL